MLRQPTVRIDYLVDEQGEIVPLLTRNQELKLLAFAIRREEDAKLLGHNPDLSFTEQTPDVKVALREAMIAREDIKNDATLREHASKLETALFSVNRAKTTDVASIREEFQSEGGEVRFEFPKANQLAYEALKPALVSGWPESEELPFEFEALLGEECFSRIFMNIPERRRYLAAVCR